MFDFFNQILGIALSLYEFAINTINSFITAVEVLLTSMAFPVMLSGFLPSVIGSAMLIVVNFAVVKFLAGR